MWRPLSLFLLWNASFTLSIPRPHVSTFYLITLDNETIPIGRDISHEIGILSRIPDPSINIQVPIHSDTVFKIIEFLQDGDAKYNSISDWISIIQAADYLKIPLIKKLYFEVLFSELQRAPQKILMEWLNALDDSDYLDHFLSFGTIEDIENLAAEHPSIEVLLTRSTLWWNYSRLRVQCGSALKQIRSVSFPDITLSNPSRICLEGLMEVKRLWFSRTPDDFVKIIGMNILDLEILEGMDVFYCLILPNMEIKDIGPLSELYSLKRLFLENNQISNVEPLQFLTSLEKLDLTENRIEVIDPLSGLVNLKTLRLSINRIKTVRPLESLVQLKKLFLHGNDIEELDGLESLVQLDRLLLSENFIRSIEPLKMLNQLTNLNLSYNKIESISTVFTMTRLLYLAITGNNLKPISCQKPSQSIIYLDISKNQLNNLDFLSCFPMLEDFRANHNNLIDMTPLKHTPLLKELYLSNNEIAHVEPVSALRGLKLLDLSYNEITHLTELALLHDLQYLNMQSNLIEDVSVLFLLKKLKVLMLSNNLLKALHPLTNLSQLVELHLNNANITDIDSLGDLDSLEVLYIANNHITNIEPLARLLNLRYVDVCNNNIVNVNPLASLNSLAFAHFHLNPVVLYGELRHIMSNPSVTDDSFDLMFWNQVDTMDIPLKRNNVFESARFLLMGRKKRDFRDSKIKFEFIGEEGVDYGGLTREFLSLYTAEVFSSAESEFFNLRSDGLYYFRHQPVTEMLKANYEYIGRVMALAVYQNVSLGIEFPSAFYNILLNPNVGFELKDLKEFDSDSYHFHAKLLNMTNNELMELDLTFVDDDGKQLSYDYDTDTTVDTENLIDYLNLKANWLIKERFVAFFDALRKGFLNLSTLNERQLKEALLGDDTINIQDWINHIEWLESVNETLMDQFESLLIRWWTTGQQERLFQLLQYTTGLKRLPRGGFAKLDPKFKIASVSEANGRNLIPSARTCFNQLELSAYDSVDVLEEKLVTAFEHGMSFSFN